MPEYDEVFSTDPDAILEISWGPTIKKYKNKKIKSADQPSVISNQPSSISNPPSSMSNPPSSMSNPPSSMSNPPSSMSNPPSSMSNPPSSMFIQPSSMPIQPSSLSNQPTSNTFSFNSTNVHNDDDDMDEPLPMTSWGSQQQQQQQQQRHTLGSNNKNDQDWNSLVDPNFTVKPGGIGSGQLHRKGGNYIPVPEMTIVNQRLKKPIPSSQNLLMLGSDGTIKKKKKRRSRKKRERVQSMPVFTIPERTVNGWGSGQLTSTPFWEQQQQHQQRQQGMERMELDQNYQQEGKQLKHPIENEKDIEIVPLLKIEIELAPGVTIPITIIKGATMMSFVSDMCRHHRLNMTEEAMASLCNTLDLLIQAKYP